MALSVLKCHYKNHSLTHSLTHSLEHHLISRVQHHTKPYEFTFMCYNCLLCSHTVGRLQEGHPACKNLTPTFPRVSQGRPVQAWPNPSLRLNTGKFSKIQEFEYAVMSEMANKCSSTVPKVPVHG